MTTPDPTSDMRPVDPTKNVLDLVQAAVDRLDDLRACDMSAIREIVEARFMYEGLLREKESQRLDAIRSVDVAAVQRAAEVSAAQAQTLQAQVATTAEAMRNQVGAAATATATSMATALEPLTKAIGELRQTQYEQQGQRTEQVDQRAMRGDSRDSTQWIVGLVVLIGISIVQIAIAVLQGGPG